MYVFLFKTVMNDIAINSNWNCKGNSVNRLYFSRLGDLNLDTWY